VNQLKQDKRFFEQLIKRGNATILEAFLILVAHPRTPVDEVEAKNNLSMMSKEDFLRFYSEKLEYDYESAGEHITKSEPDYST